MKRVFYTDNQEEWRRLNGHDDLRLMSKRDLCLDLQGIVAMS